LELVVSPLQPRQPGIEIAKSDMDESDVIRRDMPRPGFLRQARKRGACLAVAGVVERKDVGMSEPQTTAG
jgi:hypothetical protein